LPQWELVDVSSVLDDEECAVVVPDFVGTPDDDAVPEDAGLVFELVVLSLVVEAMVEERLDVRLSLVLVEVKDEDVVVEVTWPHKPTRGPAGPGPMAVNSLPQSSA
jgi:hypothetical protein